MGVGAGWGGRQVGRAYVAPEEEIIENARQAHNRFVPGASDPSYRLMRPGTIHVFQNQGARGHGAGVPPLRVRVLGKSLFRRIKANSFEVAATAWCGVIGRFRVGERLVWSKRPDVQKGCLR